MKNRIQTYYVFGAVGGALLGSVFSEQVALYAVMPCAILGGVWGWWSARKAGLR